MAPHEALIILGSVAGAILTIWKLVLPGIGIARRRWQRKERMYDVVLGTEAIPDLDRPGEFLRPAVPDMGIRMASVEGTIREYILRDAEAARRAAEGAEEKARQALREVRVLHEAARVWHKGELDVLRRLESDREG